MFGISDDVCTSGMPCYRTEDGIWELVTLDDTDL